MAVPAVYTYTPRIFSFFQSRELAIRGARYARVHAAHALARGDRARARAREFC